MATIPATLLQLHDNHIRRSQSQDESTGKKKREKRTFLAADTEIDIEFMELDLRKFCPKKIFDIIVINEVDLESQDLMSKIITTGRKYEEVSCVTFIRYSEVIALLDKFDYGILPEAVRTMVEEVLEEIKHFLSVTKPDRIPQLKMAILMKIKLIEVMILHYRRELDKMEKRKILIAELDTLTRGDRKGDGHTVSDFSRRGKSKPHLNSWLEHLDLDSDVIFDDDIFNHVWFYAFEGFYNPKILNVLLSIKVPITAIIKIEKQREGFYSYPTDTIFSKFWTDMDEFLYSHNRSELFENTMLMKFSIDDDDLLNVFEDLLYAIKSISEIKFQHLNYIRHINVHEVGHVDKHLPLQCMHTYKKIMSDIPLELVTEVVVLSSILEETCFQLDGYNIMDKCGTRNNLSDNSIKKCPDPLEISLFPQGRPYKKDIPTTFQCYHRDILSKILNMYKPCGKLVYDLSMNVLKCITPFNLLDLMNYQEDETVDHKHDIDPSDKQALKENLDVVHHFINLFIFCTFEYPEQVLESYKKEKFTQNLLTYDNVAFYNNMHPKLEDLNLGKASMFFDTSYNINPMDYYWREKYPSFILMQEILKTQENFAYVDTTYCPETDRMLVQYSDWLDEFGLNTRIYDETLLTPVCLRDFCRYTANEQAKWINENPPPKYVRKSEAVETCKGARKLGKQDIYEEYRYLLETDNLGDQDFSNLSYNQIKMNQMNEVTFDEMMNELEMYPTNNNLKQEYSKQEYSKDFTAYDFGTKYFALRGARTIFVSHDNVKITVENCKFIDESDKCTVKLQYRDHSLILHSSDCFRSYYSFHWILEDETIIVFEIQKRGRKSTKTADIDYAENDVDKSHIPDVEKEKPPFNLDNVKVKNIDEENIERIFKNSLKKEFSENRASMDIFQGLQEAIEKKRPIYKVNKKFETLKVKKPINEVPVVTLLQRVLQDVGKKVDGGLEAEESRSKRFMPTRAPNMSLTVVESAAFRVTLPNGIYLTCYTSQVKETLVEVKQEVLSKHLNAINTEEFRLFTREGYILIKKIDGTITILMSNGNKIDFEKPDTDREDIKTSRLKRPHCKTVNDYRKKLNKLMKDSGQNDYAYYISRRGVLETKRGYVINKDIIKILESSKLPYLKTSLLNFDGTKTVLEGNKISQKQLFYTVSENDFCKEEIYYERKDGFKCIFKRTASKTVEYPDGTRITSTATVANELVDGYVYITLFYKYEHPNYATVAYSEGDLLQVILNTVVIERSKDNVCTLKLDEAVTCTVDTDNVNFEKTCSKCEMSFRCMFDISPFHNNVLDYSKQFVHAEDSYLKHFFVDYGGVCRVNKNYISGTLNASNCNHMQGNIYKKLYAIKKTMSGEEFFTENMVDSYKERQEKRDYVEIVKKGKYHPVLKLKYNYYQSFPDRLLTASVLNSSVTLSKYEEQAKKILYYSTVKILCEVMNANKVQILLTHLINKFASLDVDEKIHKLVHWLAAKKEEEANLKRAESLERHEALLLEEAKYCKCVKDKKTFARKILQWGEEYKRIKKLLREGQIPLYFDSDFCQIIKKRR